MPIWHDFRLAVRRFAPLFPRCLLLFSAPFPATPSDIDDDKNFSGSEMRSYRGSLTVLERAAKAWRMQPHSFVLQLGDIIDGQNSGKYGQGLSKFPADGSESDVALHRVLALFSRYGWSSDKIYSAVGNHEFYCWPERLVVASKIPQISACTSAAGSGPGHMFQSFSPAVGWRVIILDAYDVSIIGRPPHDPAFKEAMDLLRSNNPNILPDGSASANFLTDLCARPPYHLPLPAALTFLCCSVGLSRRFVPYNGAVGRVQMDWLKGSAFPALHSLPLTIAQPLSINAVQTANSSSCAATFPFFRLRQYHRACCGIFKRSSTSSASTTPLAQTGLAE